MALYLNLYHEIQKQKLKRQRDPLKIAIMGMVVIAVALVAWYFYKVESVRSKQREATDVVDELKANDPKAADAQKQLAAYGDDIKLSDAIIHKMENRFYWAPLLEQILQIVPPEIQITGLDGSISSDGLKKVTLTVTGIATGGQPRAVAEELRIALQSKLSAAQYSQPSAIFRSLEDGTEPVQYQGKSLPTVLFVIDVTFTSPDVDEESKPKTPTRVPKS
jgi:Tfp pilus assembly protein PilN